MLKCPKCHEGELFADKNPYHLKTFTKMHSHCSRCNFKYDMEPGFFWGAMYVSYAFVIFYSGVLLLPVYILFHPPLLNLLVFNFILIILAIPVTFRISRAIWLNIFVNYDSNKVKNKPSGN